MSKIKIAVVKPFGLRLDSKTPKREFTRGEHLISQAEHDHWYMRANIKDKNVLVLGAEAQVSDDAPAGLTALVHTQKTLMALNQEPLKTLARALGLEFADTATKAQVAALVLDGQESVTLLPQEDGGYVKQAVSGQTVAGAE